MDSLAHPTSLEPSLRRELVFARLAAPDIESLVRTVTPVMTEAIGLEGAEVEAALWQALREEGCDLGRGVMVPHAELYGLGGFVVALAVLTERIAPAAPDAEPSDVFFLILAPPEASQQHLQLIAHVARLSRSRVLVDGLRAAKGASEITSLLHAAEQRHRASAQTSVAGGGVQVAITIAGETAVDALLVELVGMGLGGATILEAQSLREAARREVPLFAGFRDLLGDPGGRRLILLETDANRVDEVVASVRTICDAHNARFARVSLTPLELRWEQAAAEEPPAPEGH